METESYNSISGTIILLTLFAQSYVFGLRYCLKWVHTLILTELAIKNELLEKYSIVWKGHKIQWNSSMETTANIREKSFVLQKAIGCTLMQPIFGWFLYIILPLTIFMEMRL